MIVKKTLLLAAVFVVMLGLASPAPAGETGALLGAVTGGLIGYNVGPKSKHDVNALWGVLGGAVVGHVIQENLPKQSPVQQTVYVPPQPQQITYVGAAPAAPAVQYVQMAPAAGRRVIITRYEQVEIIEPTAAESRLANPSYQGRYSTSSYRGSGW
jgi:outer membrane lipoprotein SlyB